ncbi:MAG: hypothetical protein IJU12_07510 [Clostridia bacterium]|nr:hypothetical protein [Clostridia bacterium]
MKKALSPIRRRIRLQHGLTGLCWGLLGQTAFSLVILILSFFIPLEKRNAWIIAGLALPCMGLLMGLLWPVSYLQAARKADEQGLKERAQTAWSLQDRQDDMARLQREDAISHLKTMPRMPLRVSAKPLIAAGACMAAALILFFVPNPQDGVLRQRADLRQKLEKPAAALEKAADKLEDSVLDKKTVQELRRLLGDLARETRQARDSREALTQVSQAQQRMEKLLGDARNAASEALGQAGLDALAEALEAGDLSAMQQALENMDGEALSQAAQNAASAAAASAMQAAAQSLASGNAAQAAQALGQLSAQGAASAAMQSAKSAALGGQGQGKGQGQGQGQSGSGQGGNGQGAGSGAGAGSTNEDAGAGSPGGKQSASAGGREGRYHLGEYEQIYDPTRLGDGGEITQSTGQVDENAQMSELNLSPGLGNTAGSIPYDQVVGEYQAAAVQRAQEAALPGYAQQWVADYFSALTE